MGPAHLSRRLCHSCSDGLALPPVEQPLLLKVQLAAGPRWGGRYGWAVGWHGCCFCGRPAVPAASTAVLALLNLDCLVSMWAVTGNCCLLISQCDCCGPRWLLSIQTSHSMLSGRLHICLPLRLACRTPISNGVCKVESETGADHFNVVRLDNGLALRRVNSTRAAPGCSVGTSSAACVEPLGLSLPNEEAGCGACQGAAQHCCFLRPQTQGEAYAQRKQQGQGAISKYVSRGQSQCSWAVASACTCLHQQRRRAPVQAGAS